MSLYSAITTTQWEITAKEEYVSLIESSNELTDTEVGSQDMGIS
jgi:hypothetical protein